MTDQHADSASSVSLYFHLLQPGLSLHRFFSRAGRNDFLDKSPITHGASSPCAGEVRYQGCKRVSTLIFSSKSVYEITAKSQPGCPISTKSIPKLRDMARPAFQTLRTLAPETRLACNCKALQAVDASDGPAPFFYATRLACARTRQQVIAPY